MNFEGLLNELSRIGVQLRVGGDQLRFRPKGALMPELEEAMKAHKPRLLANSRQQDPVLASYWQLALDDREVEGAPPGWVQSFRAASVLRDRRPPQNSTPPPGSDDELDRE